MTKTPTSYATTETWAGQTPIVDVVPPTFCVAAPVAFREYSGAPIGEMFAPLELAVPGATRHIDRSTHERLLNEGMSRYRSLWASLATK